MVKNNSEIGELEKLVNNIPLATLDIPIPKQGLTIKRAYRIRRIAESLGDRDGRN